MERSLYRNDDLSISIAGLDSGSRSFSASVMAKEVSSLASVFQGAIEIEGTVRRLGSRFYVDASVAAPATLVCDRSLEQYVEQIECDLSMMYELDAEMAIEQKGKDLADQDVRGLLPDAQYIDLSEDVRQELALGLPMKRIAPQYRNQSIEEIFPGLQQSEDQPDSRWEALNKLRGNKS